IDEITNEPLVVVFADGRVVARDAGSGPPRWRQRRLARKQLGALVTALEVDALAELPAVVSCRPGWWSQPLTRIAVRREDGWLVRQVHGRETCDRMERARAAGIADPRSEVIEEWRREDAINWPFDHSAVPAPFARARAALLGVIPERAEPWTPREFWV